MSLKGQAHNHVRDNLLDEVQENSNIQMNDMVMTIHDLRQQFTKEK